MSLRRYSSTLRSKIPPELISSPSKSLSASPKANEIIGIELAKSAHNYHPLPVVIARASGIFMYDITGKRYFGTSTTPPSFPLY